MAGNRPSENILSSRNKLRDVLKKVNPAAVCRIHCSRKKIGALAQARGSKSQKRLRR